MNAAQRGLLKNAMIEKTSEANPVTGYKPEIPMIEIPVFLIAWM